MNITSRSIVHFSFTLSKSLWNQIKHPKEKKNDDSILNISKRT